MRAVGCKLSRPVADRAWHLPRARGRRLLVAPVFIVSVPRPGSALLRAIPAGRRAAAVAAWLCF